MSSQYPILDNRPIDQWKVTELKEELRKRKLTTKGLKEDLVRRLFESITSEAELQQKNESENAPESDPIQQIIQNVDDDKGPGLDQHEADGHKLAETNSKEKDRDVAMADANHSHADSSMVDQVCEQSVQEVGLEENQADVNAHKTEDNASDQELKAPIEQPPTTDEHMVAVDEEIELKTVVQNDDADNSTFPSKSSIENSVHEDLQSPQEDAFNPSEPIDQVSELKHRSSGSLSPAQLESECQESIPIAPDDSNPFPEDIIREQVEQNNQVSEAKPSLGFHVSSELLSSDSVSISKKNELKDNLNANDFPLELEVVKPEMGHSSSSIIAPVAGDSQTLDTVSEPGIDLGSSEEIDVTLNSNEGNLGEKLDSADAGYPEKLNLDRSSGEESMEEDVLETKQINSDLNPDEEEHKNLINKLHEEQSTLDAGASQPSLVDIITQEEPEPTINSEKRKLEASDTVRVHEPSKRQRRWNSEPVKAPEHPPSNITPIITPRASVQLPLKRSFSRSDSTVSADSPKERIVPPSQKPPTNSLRIDRFLRPFTLKSVQELLSKSGTVCNFWMDNIKTHCYVTFSSEEEAIATRNAVYNLQWPPNGGRLLIAEFVDPQEVKLRVEAPPESPAPITSPSPRTPASGPQTPASQFPARQHGVKQQLPPPPPLPPPPALADLPIIRERQQLPPPPRKKPEPPKPEPPVLTLDDLFIKTKATPRIYYLPLSEEEVAAKVQRKPK